jgi:hypothetical protein
MRVLRASAFYVVWALFVTASLLAAYRIDPYVFGFASLAFAWATGAVAVAGLAAVVFSRGSSGRSKVLVAGALLVAAAAVAVALHTLGGFTWA